MSSWAYMALRTAAVCTPQIFKNPQLISRVMFVATGCSWQTAGRGGKTQKNDSLSSTTHTSLLGRARDDDRNLRLGLHTAAAIARVRGGSALRALQNHRSLLKAQEDEVACEAAATEGLAESKSQLRAVQTTACIEVILGKSVSGARRRYRT